MPFELKNNLVSTSFNVLGGGETDRNNLYYFVKLFGLNVYPKIK